MEEELKKNFENVSVELIRGAGGVFEVKVDGKMIFSKNSGAKPTYRFPDKGEVTGLIRQQ